eukprot:6635912-Prymnesium_polylepis.1
MLAPVDGHASERDAFDGAHAMLPSKVLRGIFDAVDVKGNSRISRAELARKLKSDDEIQRLIIEAGGDGTMSLEGIFDQ